MYKRQSGNYFGRTPPGRIKFERWPEYKIEVTRSGTDDVSEPVGYELVSQQMFKADAEVSYPEACDSSKVNLKIREAGVFEQIYPGA